MTTRPGDAQRPPGRVACAVGSDPGAVAVVTAPRDHQERESGMQTNDVGVQVQGVGKNTWLLWLVMGILSIGVGVWLLFSPGVAIATLAILLAIALFMNGLSELITAGGRHHPWFGYLLGALFLVAGVIVLIRPGKSLWFLAVFVGASLLITGAIQVVMAIADREHERHWVLLVVVGLLGIAAGVLAVVWPGITILVLALLVGIRLIMWGVLQLIIASQLKTLAG